ncbi:hypothetical protein BO91_01525 [Candidatus Synechococcus spongiarum LMB bulk10E]|nr:hypothetical protein BO91_01525 [Candidatus Synechococcus spongiarum LMB bulk10E]
MPQRPRWEWEEYVNDMAHTNGIESFRSVLKRGSRACSTKIGPERLNRYVSGFAGRYTVHLPDTVDIMVGMVAGMVGRRVSWHKLAVGLINVGCDSLENGYM